MTVTGSPYRQDLLQPQHLGEIVDLSELWDNLAASWKRIALLTVAGAALGLAVSLTTTPEYRANAMVRIEPELTTAGEPTTLDAETEIITAWSTLQQAVQSMNRSVEVHLDQSVLATRLSYLVRKLRGAFWPQGALDDDMRAEPWVQVGYFYTPDHYLNQKFRLKIGKEGSYELLGPDDDVLVRGELSHEFVKPPEDITPGTMDIASTRIAVIDADAPPGTEFILVPRSNKRFTEMIRRDLLALRRGYRALGSSGSSGLIQVSFASKDPAFAEGFLRHLVDSYTQHAYDRSSLGKIQSLKHLEDHLEKLQAKMDEAGKELAEFRSKESVSDLSIETQLALERISKIEEQITALQSRQKELQVSHGPQHPVMMSLKSQIGMMHGEVATLDQMLNRLPELERRLAQLTRHQDHFNHLYQAGLKVYAELRTQVEGITGYARIVSEARLQEPSMMQWTLKLALLGALAGGLLSSMWAFFRSLPLFIRIHRPEQLHATAAVPLIAIVPRFKTAKEDRTPPAMALMKQGEHKAHKVLDFLVSKWRFTTYGTTNKVVAVTATDHEQGKSFLSVSLAMMNAKHRKTVLVNADLTRHRQRYPVGGETDKGLSELIVGEATVAETLVPIIADKLYYLPPGSRAMSGKLLRDQDRMKAIMDELSTQFDCIIVDYPVVTAADPVDELLKFAGSAFLVVRYGSAALKLKRLLQRFPNGFAPVTAMVLNDVPLNAGQ